MSMVSVISNVKQVTLWWLGWHPKQSTAQKVWRGLALVVAPFGMVMAGFRVLMHNMGSKKIGGASEILAWAITCLGTMALTLLFIMTISPSLANPLTPLIALGISLLNWLVALGVSACDNDELDIEREDALQRRPLQEVIESVQRYAALAAEALRVELPDTTQWSALSRNQLVSLEKALRTIWEAPTMQGDSIRTMQAVLDERKQSFQATLIAARDMLCSNEKQQQRELVIEQRVEQLKTIVEV